MLLAGVLIWRELVTASERPDTTQYFGRRRRRHPTD
jgi:hypothetical protein